MPTTAKGANVFRASVGHHSPAVFPGLEDDGEGEGNGNGNGDDDGDGDGEGEAEKSPIPWSPSPPPQGHSPAPLKDRSPTPLSFAPSHKRKHSALSALSSAAASARSTPSASSGPKRARKEVTGPVALQGLTAELSTFGQTFLEGVTSTVPPPPLLAPSPSRKTKAIQRAQELEDELDDDRLAALIRVFQADVNAADAYLVIKREGLRRAWIASTLGGI
jgi:hypothetical protein